MNASEANSASDDIFRFMLQFVNPYTIYTLLREIHEKNAHIKFSFLCDFHSTYYTFFTEHFTHND